MLAVLAITLLAQADCGRSGERCRDERGSRSQTSGCSPGGYALDGHSILAGYNSSFSIPAGIEAVTHVSTPTTLAVAGSRTSACVSRYAGRIAACGFSVLDWQCAVNDIAFDSADPVAIEQAAEVAWNSAYARGTYVILNSELPCGDAGASVGGACWGTTPTSLQDYNAFANFWAVVHGSSARYLDVATFVGDGGTALDPAYASPDFLHLNDAGAGVLMQKIIDAIDAGPIGAEAGSRVVELGAAGLGTACACATITTDDGGAITYTRAGTAYCSTQGSWKTSGITNSSIAACAANKPRVEPGYDGGVSLLVEPAVVNTTTFPTNLAGADWATQGVVVATPVVTANAATDPFGNVAATRLDLAATASAAQGSLIYNLTGCEGGSGNPTTQGLYIKGVSGSGTIDVCVYDVGAGTAVGNCFDCAFVSATWTRCHRDNFVTTVGTNYYILGNANFYTGSGVGRPAQSVYVQGATCDISKNLTSFSGTGRATETATAAASLLSGAFSASATWDAPQTLLAGQSFFQARKDASNYNRGFTVPSALRCDFVSGAASSTVTTPVGHDLVAGASNHPWCAYAVSAKVAYTDSPWMTRAAVTLANGSSTIYIGGTATAGQEATGWIRDFTVATSAGGAR